jgi:hypothetical protein
MFVLFQFSSLPSSCSPDKVRPSNDDDVDVIIVGAGTAGSTLAVSLARQGRKVLLIERSFHIPVSDAHHCAMLSTLIADVSSPFACTLSAFPYQERIVGELLQPGGYRCLQRLGLSQCVEPANCSSVIIGGYVVLKVHDRIHCYCLLSARTSLLASIRRYEAFLNSEIRLTCERALQSPVCPQVANEPSFIMLNYPESDPASPIEYFGSTASNSGAEKPTGRGLHNHLFVRNLRAAAVAEPNVVRRGWFRLICDCN